MCVCLVCVCMCVFGLCLPQIICPSCVNFDLKSSLVPICLLAALAQIFEDFILTVGFDKIYFVLFYLVSTLIFNVRDVCN